MKPVFIIGLAVVCSVAAVLGVLVVLDQVATNQAQQAYDEYEQELKIQEKIEQNYLDFLDSKNRDICVGLFGNQMGDIYSGKMHIYEYCLQFGFESSVEQKINECYDFQFPLSSITCALSLEIKLIDVLKSIEGFSELQLQILEDKQSKLIKELTILEDAELANEGTLLFDLPENISFSESGMNAIYCEMGDEEACKISKENPTEFMILFKNLAERHANELKEKYPETAIAGDEIKLMKQQALEEYLNSDSSEWYEIYSNCLSTPIKYFEQVHVRGTFCTEIIENAWDQTCDYKSTTCQLLLSDIMNNEPLWSNVQNIHNETWDSYSKSCKANGGTDYKKCMCDTELISQKWVELCIDMP